MITRTRELHNENIINALLLLNKLTNDLFVYGLHTLESELIHNKNLERDPYDGYLDITINQALMIIKGILASKLIPEEEPSKATIEDISLTHQEKEQ